MNGLAPADDCERLREIEAIVDEISARAEQGAVVLVEGLKDKASVEALGIRNNIVLTSRQSLFNLTERIAEKKSGRFSTVKTDVIILTDWDERGEEVARNAEAYLVANGARPDGELRKKLRLLTKKEVRDIESLHGYVERLRLICSVKPQHY